MLRKEITPLRHKGRLGDQAHFQDLRQPSGTRGFQSRRARAKAKVREGKVSPRAKERGISATSRIIGNPRWAKYKIRGCTSRLLSMINGALNPISTVSCPYVLCTRQRWVQEHDDWTKVKTHRGGRGTARQGTHQTSSCQQQTPCAGSRFAVLSDGGIDAFPILSAAQEPSARKPRMIALPRRVGQSVFKNAVKQFRKLKENEKKPLLVATVNAGVSDSEFARKADEIRHECWEERVRAKGETRHGRHQTLYKDRPTNAMP